MRIPMLGDDHHMSEGRETSEGGDPEVVVGNADKDVGRGGA